MPFHEIQNEFKEIDDKVTIILKKLNIGEDLNPSDIDVNFLMAL
jgi:hypothetical protein